MPVAANTTVVIAGLVPGTHPSTNAEACGPMDPGHKARDDN